jgi:hypothetical protein
MAATDSLANTTWTATNDDGTQFQFTFGSGPTSVSSPGSGSVLNFSNNTTTTIQWGETEGKDANEWLFVVSANQWSPANGCWIGKHQPGKGAGSGYVLLNPTNSTQHTLQGFTMTKN